MAEEIITEGKDGIFRVGKRKTKEYERTQKIKEFAKELKNNPYWVLHREIYDAKKEKPLNVPFLGFLGSFAGNKSKIHGIESIFGKDYTITVFLQDALQLDLLKGIVDNSEVFYLKPENILGDKFYQVRRKGGFLTAYFPIIVLDKLKDKSDYLEIRKSFFTPNLSTGILREYFKKLYGEFKLKD